MLIGDDDLEREWHQRNVGRRFPVPLDDYELERPTPSGVERRTNLPEPFQPAMLATLEQQCRDFFR